MNRPPLFFLHFSAPLEVPGFYLEKITALIHNPSLTEEILVRPTVVLATSKKVDKIIALGSLPLLYPWQMRQSVAGWYAEGF